MSMVVTPLEFLILISVFIVILNINVFVVVDAAADVFEGGSEVVGGALHGGHLGAAAANLGLDPAPDDQHLAQSEVDNPRAAKPFDQLGGGQMTEVQGRQPDKLLLVGREQDHIRAFSEISTRSRSSSKTIIINSLTFSIIINF
jgi:hypothetical protein